MDTVTDNVRLALARYRQHAKKVALDAGYSGAMNDGGASFMEAKAQAFEDGWNHKVPDFLVEACEQIQREANPEYAEYLRLQQKFGLPS